MQTPKMDLQSSVSRDFSQQLVETTYFHGMLFNKH